MSDDKIIKLHGHEDHELEALYKKAAQPAPPAHLDSVIKSAAREASPARRPGITPWFAGIAVSVLVGVLLIRLYPTSLPQYASIYLEKEMRPNSDSPLKTVTNTSMQPSPVNALTERLRVKSLNSGGASRLNSVGEFSEPDHTEPLPPAAPIENSLTGIEEINARHEKQAATSSQVRDSSPGAKTESAIADEVQTIAPALSKMSALPEPQSVLKHIIELILQNKTQEAHLAYQKFRQEYPDVVIEPEIAAQLDKLQSTQPE